MSFARLFKFLVLPGQEQVYSDYVRDVVTPIDEAAHKAGVFDRLQTIIPQAGKDWNHGSIFFFRDLGQRDVFTARMAQQAAIFDGSDAATKDRKSHAETMRRLVGTSDFQVL